MFTDTIIQSKYLDMCAPCYAKAQKDAHEAYAKSYEEKINTMKVLNAKVQPAKLYYVDTKYVSKEGLLSRLLIFLGIFWPNNFFDIGRVRHELEERGNPFNGWIVGEFTWEGTHSHYEPRGDMSSHTPFKVRVLTAIVGTGSVVGGEVGWFHPVQPDGEGYRVMKGVKEDGHIVEEAAAWDAAKRLASKAKRDFS
jgi:hypothetical protein